MLVIVADDFGYAPSYDEGILTAVRAQAVDAVSVMALRTGSSAALEPACAAAEVEIGLHLESGVPLAEQVDAFERWLGRGPAYLDGHHHCHASPGVAEPVAREAAARAIPVRAVDGAHRALLREHGVATADRLVGRLAESESLVPEEIEASLRGDPPPGTTEWMVHPGNAGGPSSYDAGRERDLERLLGLGDRASWLRRGVRRSAPSRALA